MPAFETPNPKHQTPNNFQPPISNRLNLRSAAFTPLHHRLPIGESMFYELSTPRAARRV
jgi:hypothetical protein